MNTYQFIKLHSRENPGFSIFLSLVLYLVGMVVILPLTGILIGTGYGISLNDVLSIIGGDFSVHPQSETIFRLFQGANQLATWGLVGVIMTHLLGIFPQVLGLRSQTPILAIVLAIFLLMISFPLIQLFHLDLSFMGSWGESMMAQEEKGQEMLKRLVLKESTSQILFNLLVFAALPAICEEIFFRGFLQTQLYKWVNPHLAVWIGAFIFSLVHFQVPGLLSRMVPAVLLGYFFYSTKNVLPCILAHFFYNVLSILFTYVSENSLVFEPKPGEFLAISLVSLILTGAVAYWYVKKYSPEHPHSESAHE